MSAVDQQNDQEGNIKGNPPPQKRLPPPPRGARAVSYQLNEDELTPIIKEINPDYSSRSATPRVSGSQSVASSGVTSPNAKPNVPGEQPAVQKQEVPKAVVPEEKIEKEVEKPKEECEKPKIKEEIEEKPKPKEECEKSKPKEEEPKGPCEKLKEEEPQNPCENQKQDTEAETELRKPSRIIITDIHKDQVGQSDHELDAKVDQTVEKKDEPKEVEKEKVEQEDKVVQNQTPLEKEKPIVEKEKPIEKDPLVEKEKPLEQDVIVEIQKPVVEKEKPAEKEHPPKMDKPEPEEKQRPASPAPLAPAPPPVRAQPTVDVDLVGEDVPGSEPTPATQARLPPPKARTPTPKQNLADPPPPRDQANVLEAATSPRALKPPAPRQAPEDETPALVKDSKPEAEKLTILATLAPPPDLVSPPPPPPPDFEEAHDDGDAPPPPPPAPADDLSSDDLVRLQLQRAEEVKAKESQAIMAARIQNASNYSQKKRAAAEAKLQAERQEQAEKEAKEAARKERTRQKMEADLLKPAESIVAEVPALNELPDTTKAFLVEGSTLTQHFLEESSEDKHVFVTNDLASFVFKPRKAISISESCKTNTTRLISVTKGRASPPLQKKRLGRWRAKEECAFSIETRSGETLDFETETAEARDQWVDALRLLIRYAATQMIDAS